MKHTVTFTAGTVLLVLGLITTPTMASKTHDTGKEQAGGFAALGVVYSPDYEGGDDYESIIAPFGQYKWSSRRYVSLGGISGVEKAARIKSNVITKKQSNIWEFGPLLQYRFERDDIDIDNGKVDKLKGVDAATEFGAFVGLNAAPWSAVLSIATDVSSEHDGTLVYLDGGYDIQISGKFSTNLAAHLTWVDGNYMSSNFGVSGSEPIKSGLSRYESSSGFKNVGFSMSGYYRFNRNWGIMGNIGYTRMINDAKDSQIVNDLGNENQYGVVVAVIYAF